MSQTQTQSATASSSLPDRYREVRQTTMRLCEPLIIEDYIIQSMPDVSPTKWHLAHTAWFFETFVLLPHARGYRPFDPQFSYLFNSYYVGAGDRHCRDKRGVISRPTVQQVRDYREHVDAHMVDWLAQSSDAEFDARGALIELGLNHEQQHQELLLTDIKHVFWSNPVRPAYHDRAPVARKDAAPMRWIGFSEGIHQIGHAGESFAYDNEMPRHRAFVEDFEIASRLVTCGEYRAFIDDGGYERPNLWLSLGWHAVQENQWRAPLYWELRDDGWHVHTLSGMRPVEDSEPVCHLSYFEADAFARWAGARLATEPQWEVAAASSAVNGNMMDDGIYHPAPADDAPGLRQMFGDAWEWTASAYLPYPGYRAPSGTIGEYNGKFMCNQFVLRGGSCATPGSHIRATYRNFFPPEARWQFSGIRLARDA